jgi:hypothetical protein
MKPGYLLAGSGAAAEFGLDEMTIVFTRVVLASGSIGDRAWLGHALAANAR